MQLVLSYVIRLLFDSVVFRPALATEMGDRVRVQFPVPDIYFGM